MEEKEGRFVDGGERDREMWMTNYGQPAVFLRHCNDALDTVTEFDNSGVLLDHL